MNAAKTLLLTLSVAGNILLVALIMLTLSRKTGSVSFLELDSENRRYTTGACIVSLPEDGSALVFAPLEFLLRAGDRAAVQFSALSRGGQMNIAASPLYDRAVVSVESSGYGYIVRALAPGVTVLQTVTEDGIRDIARVTVTE